MKLFFLVKKDIYFDNYKDIILEDTGHLIPRCYFILSSLH